MIVIVIQIEFLIANTQAMCQGLAINKRQEILIDSNQL